MLFSFKIFYFIGTLFATYYVTSDDQVKYNTPSRSVTDDDGDSISHLEWETVRVSSMFPVDLEYEYL